MAKIATESWSNMQSTRRQPRAVPDGFPQIEFLADNHSFADRLLAQCHGSRTSRVKRCRLARALPHKRKEGPRQRRS